MDLDITLS